MKDSLVALKRKWPLSRWVFVFVVLVLVFATTISSSLFSWMFSQWWDREYKQQIEVGTVLAGELIYSDLQNYRHLVLYINNLVDVFGQRANPQFILSVKNLIDEFDSLKGVSLFDQTGDPLFVGEEAWENVELHFLIPRHELVLTNEGITVVSHPETRLSYLLFWNKDARGNVNCFLFSLEEIMRHFQIQAQIYQASIGIVDIYGHYVAHSSPQVLLVSAGIGHLALFQDFVRSNVTMTSFENVAINRAVSYVVRRIEGLPWFVVVEVPGDLWRDFFRRYMLQILLVFFVVMALSTLLAYQVSLYLDKAFTMFVDSSKAILTKTPYEKKNFLSFPEIEFFVSTIEQLARTLQAEQDSLRYSRQIIQDIVNSLGEGLLLIRPEGTVAYVNPEGAKILSIAPKTDFDALVRGSSQGGFGLPLPLLMAIKPYERRYEAREEVMLYLPNGEKHWFIVQSKDWYNPEELFLGKIVSLSDITDRKTTAQELLASEKRLSAALETANAIVWDWQVINNAFLISDDWNKKTGKEAPTIFAQWLEQIDTHESPTIRAALLEYCHGKRKEFMIEHRIPGKNDEEIWVLNKAHIVERDIFQQPLRLIGVMVDITTLKVQQQQIQISLAEKETLLKEIHHRVKNNLQIISSLLALQSDLNSDAVFQHILQDSQVRIRSMALIHEKLYQTKSFSLISFHDYIAELVDAIRSIYATHPLLEINIHASEISLPLEVCIPLGLWLSEAVTNAFKYAFTGDNEHPRLTILFAAQGEGFVLDVCDNGPGFDTGLIQQTSSLGLKLLHILAEQIHGTVHFTNEHGLHIRLEFPRP